MKKPEIGKRLVPLLDLIFLLLIFFLILPHGVHSRQLLQIDQLKQEKQEIKAESQSRDREMKRELEYYRSQYGSQDESAAKRAVRPLIVTLKDNLLFLGPDPNKLQPVSTAEAMKERLKNAMTGKNFNYVIIQLTGDEGVEEGPLEDLMDYLEKQLKVQCDYVDGLIQ